MKACSFLRSINPNLHQGNSEEILPLKPRRLSSDSQRPISQRTKIGGRLLNKYKPVRLQSIPNSSDALHTYQVSAVKKKKPSHGSTHCKDKPCPQSKEVTSARRVRSQECEVDELFFSHWNHKSIPKEVPICRWSVFSFPPKFAGPTWSPQNIKKCELATFPRTSGSTKKSTSVKYR